MAALISNYVYDLMSWGKTRAPDFKTSFIAQLLAQSNELMYDMMYLEANMPNGHLLTDQTALPTTYTPSFNDTVQVTRGQTAQREETLAMFQTLAQYDVNMLNLWADKGQFLLEQSQGLYVESDGAEVLQDLLVRRTPRWTPTQFTGHGAGTRPPRTPRTRSTRRTW